MPRRSLSKYEVLMVYARDKGICRICGKEVKADQVSIDHIVLLARGDAREPTNWQLAHRSCNARKGILSELKHTDEHPVHMVLYLRPSLLRLVDDLAYRERRVVRPSRNAWLVERIQRIVEQEETRHEREADDNQRQPEHQP